MSKYKAKDRPRQEKLTRFVDSMVEIGARQLVETLQIDSDQAATAMRMVAHEFCKVYARTLVYIPMDVQVEMSLRDQKIWAEYGEERASSRKYSPARVEELAAAYEMTTTHIYNITRLMRAKQRADEAAEWASRQGALVLDEGA
jgi:Mor family transcriptional regulator